MKGLFSSTKSFCKSLRLKYSPCCSCTCRSAGLSHSADPGHLHSSLSSPQCQRARPGQDRSAPCPTQHPAMELNTCALLLGATSTGKQGNAPGAQLSWQQRLVFTPPGSAHQVLSHLRQRPWDGICRFLQAGEHLQAMLHRWALLCSRSPVHPAPILPTGIHQLSLLIIFPLLARSLLFCGMQAWQLLPLLICPFPPSWLKKDPTEQKTPQRIIQVVWQRQEITVHLDHAVPWSPSQGSQGASLGTVAHELPISRRASIYFLNNS